MKKILSTLAALMLAGGLSVTEAFAGGTPAGTDISNQATAQYTVGASTLTANSNVNTIKVAEILNLTLTWQDAAPGVTVTVGQTDRVTTYRLTNTGNGTETFGLTKADAGLGGDDFDPTVTQIYLDANGNGTYDAGTDTLYAAGTNDPTLARDGSLTIFLLSSIPGAGPVDGNTGNVRLTATSMTGTGAPGMTFARAGDGGGDAVVGSSGGSALDTGTYVVSGITVSVTKSAAVTDLFGGTEPIPGATIRYTLSVTATGAGTAVGVVITDPIPANTTSTAGTLTLNAAGLSDAADVDAGDVGGTTAGTVTVSLGDMTNATPAQTITFDMTIN